MVNWIKNISKLFVLLFLTSCSSPESDGEKAANNFRSCEEKLASDMEKMVRKYIDGFRGCNFTTRVEARQKLADGVDEVNREYLNNLQEAKADYAQLKGKYANSYQDAQAFELAYRNHMKLSGGNARNRNEIPMVNEVESLIKSIIPPKPTVEKIKLDLVGRTWQDKADGYFGSRKQVIGDGSVKDVEILSESSQPDVYTFNALVKLQDRPGSAVFDLNADIKYQLGDADDWTIDYLYANSVNIEKTGQFDGFITVENIPAYFMGGNTIRINNNCDATLIVGGIYLVDGGVCNQSEWKKFSVEIAPNGYVGMCEGLYHINEYEIHFVERK